MMLFVAVALIVGTVTACLFGVDTALWAGKRTVDIWIIAGLVLTVLAPFVDIYRFIKVAVQWIYRLFNRNKA